MSRVRACKFLAFLLLTALLTAEARAQQPAKVHLIRYPIYGSPASVAHRTEALRMGEGGETIDDFLTGFPTVRREQVVAFLEEATARMISKAS